MMKLIATTFKCCKCGNDLIIKHNNEVQTTTCKKCKKKYQRMSNGEIEEVKE